MSTTVDRATMLKVAYAHAMASAGLARQATAESDGLLSLISTSAQDPSFAAPRDAAEHLAALWTDAARDLAILEALRGLSDPATYGDEGPSLGWFGARQNLGPIEAVPGSDMAPSQIDSDPE